MNNIMPTKDEIARVVFKIKYEINHNMKLHDLHIPLHYLTSGWFWKDLKKEYGFKWYHSELTFLKHMGYTGE